MKKTVLIFSVVAILAAVALLFGFKAFAKNDPGNPSQFSTSDCGGRSLPMKVEVKEDQNIKYEISGEDSDRYLDGEKYTLEYEQDGQWYVVPQHGIITMEGIIFLGDEETGASRIKACGTIDLKEQCGNLKSGHYRLIKEVTRLTSPEWEAAEDYWAMAEFDL